MAPRRPGERIERSIHQEPERSWPLYTCNESRHEAMRDIGSPIRPWISRGASTLRSWAWLTRYQGSFHVLDSIIAFAKLRVSLGFTGGRGWWQRTQCVIENEINVAIVDVLRFVLELQPKLTWYPRIYLSKALQAPRTIQEHRPCNFGGCHFVVWIPQFVILVIWLFIASRVGVRKGRAEIGHEDQSCQFSGTELGFGKDHTILDTWHGVPRDTTFKIVENLALIYQSPRVLWETSCLVVRPLLLVEICKVTERCTVARICVVDVCFLRGLEAVSWRHRL
jgi:hypothetical protein